MKKVKLKKERQRLTTWCALLFFFPFSFFLFNSAAAKEENVYFAIIVVDDQTGRGVPLVELRTVSEIKFYTDSNGVVAFNEPGLMDRKVFFHIKSHGYEVPPDGFGVRGKVLDVKAGGSATIKIKRINVAERMYRLTGEGIYRDSVLLGLPVPLEKPVINASVSGQDSVQMTQHLGKLYWFFGDTNRPGYALGHFGTSGATSKLPADGGLDPAKGVNLTYFAGLDGFSRPMVGGPEPGPRWIQGLLNVKDDSGAEKLVTMCSRMKNLGEVHDRHLMVLNDTTNEFEKIAPISAEHPRNFVGSNAQAVRVKFGEQDYFCFCAPYPLVRVKADWKSVIDPAAYESYTCLERGTRYSKGAAKVERADGKVVWGWKAETSPIDWKQQDELVAAKQLNENERYFVMTDIETGKPVHGHSGSVHYNAYRKMWIMLLEQYGGSSSLLGEVYYSEAPEATGPWEKARKIVTHDKYTFYNVAQHPEFDQEGGRYVYFQGTYTTTFSGNTDPTPRYEYNQVMYRLDLSDERLRGK